MERNGYIPPLAGVSSSPFGPLNNVQVQLMGGSYVHKQPSGSDSWLLMERHHNCKTLVLLILCSGGEPNDTNLFNILKPNNEEVSMCECETGVV